MQQDSSGEAGSGKVEITCEFSFFVVVVVVVSNNCGDGDDIRLSLASTKQPHSWGHCRVFSSLHSMSSPLVHTCSLCMLPLASAQAQAGHATAALMSR